MTNKINGIDVSECKFYEPKAQKMTCHEEVITKPCESTPICYYKLLQKSYIEIQRLQKENEELKEKNKGLLNLCNNGGALLVTESAKTKKYKQALENIKQFLIFADHSNTGNKYFENVEKALNIANEVLNDRD